MAWMVAVFSIDRKPRCELTHDGRPLIERPGDLLPKSAWTRWLLCHRA